MSALSRQNPRQNPEGQSQPGAVPGADAPNTAAAGAAPAGASPSLRVIAGALWAPAPAVARPVDPLAPARPPLPGAAAVDPGPALTLPPELTSWLASWEPAPLRCYEPDGPLLTELAHERWLREWFDETASGPGSRRSPGWLAATRALADGPGHFDEALLWLAEPAHLHVATDHLILIHGAAETLSEDDGKALLAAAGPMFDDAGIGHRAADARHWLVWPQSPAAAGPALASTSASFSASASASAPTSTPAAVAGTTGARTPAAAGPPKGRISVKVVGRAPERQARLDETATATSAAAAHGHSVEEYLPRGPAGRPLRQLFNGVQMAWHEHAVNLQRSRDGLPTINSLWFTGPTSASDIARWRERAPAAGLTVDEGPLLARLNGDEAGWTLELTEALLRAAADPTITTLVLCGERGVLELRRKTATAPGASAAAIRPAFDTEPAPPSAGLFDTLKKLGQRLGLNLGQGADAAAASRRPTKGQPPASKHPAHWFREPGDWT